jgi:hypothetical protein
MLHARRAAIAASLVLLSSQPALAQSHGGWEYGVTPYFWLASLTGEVGVGPVATNVDLSFSDIVKVLHFAAMGGVEARKNSYVLMTDAFYVSLGDGRAVAFRGDTGLYTLNVQLFILQPSAGYTWGGASWAVDALASIRFWSLRTTLDVDRNMGRPSNKRGTTQDWVDAIGGLRGQWMPIEGWRVIAAGDGGGGGSDGTWQAYGGIGADISKHWGASVLYRGLHVNYDTNNFLFDATLKGTVITATYKW